MTNTEPTEGTRWGIHLLSEGGEGETRFPRIRDTLPIVSGRVDEHEPEDDYDRINVRNASYIDAHRVEDDYLDHVRSVHVEDRAQRTVPSSPHPALKPDPPRQGLRALVSRVTEPSRRRPRRGRAPRSTEDTAALPVPGRGSTRKDRHPLFDTAPTPGEWDLPRTHDLLITPEGTIAFSSDKDVHVIDLAPRRPPGPAARTETREMFAPHDDEVTMTQAETIDTLRRRTSEKWSTYPTDVLPMFVAEMDFPLAPAIKDALREALDLGDTGYVNTRDSDTAGAFASYARAAWGWTPSPTRMRYTTDVSVVIVESLRRLLPPGDGVVITPPVYPPFYDLVPEGGGSVVEVPLLDDGDTYALDLDGIDHALATGARGVLLCSPHNPVGLVHSKRTLVELSRIVARHDAFVISDEIHAPLTHRGNEFTPYLSVSEEAREHGIAAASGSKAFNLAGLKTALFVTESDRMSEVVESLPEEVSVRTGLFGLIATRAGFTSGRQWLEETVATVEGNLALLERRLAEKLPRVRLRRPEATYLAWLDMSALGWGDDPAQHSMKHAGVALSSGPSFGAQGAGYARMNLACAPATIIEAVDRLAAAVAQETSGPTMSG